MAGLSEQEELLMLRKRARRRLVGAIVLVLIAIVLLWRVVGHVQTQPGMKPDTVVVEDGSASTPVAARPAVAPGVELASAPASKTDLPASLSSVAPPADASQPRATPAVTPQAAPTPAVKKPDPAAILEDRADSPAKPERAKASSASHERASGAYSIQLAALSERSKADELRNRLADLGVKAYFSKVETSKGPVTRVRVGPFASREAADALLKMLSRSGVSGIVVTQSTP